MTEWHAVSGEARLLLGDARRLSCGVELVKNAYAVERGDRYGGRQRLWDVVCEFRRMTIVRKDARAANIACQNLTARPTWAGTASNLFTLKVWSCEMHFFGAENSFE